MSKRLPPVERFWLKVNKEDQSGCWIWTGYLNQDGYGRTRTPIRRTRPRYELAHRIAYELLVGPFPEGLETDHLCKRRACVNPAHLEPVTHAENLRRSPNPKKSHCPRGHPYSGENLYINPYNNAKNCRECHRAFSKEFEKTRIRKRKHE
jgi:hypothetical protein